MPHRSVVTVSALAALLRIAVALAQTPAPIRAQAATAPSRLSTPEELQAEFADVPCEDADRQAAVRALLVKAGAPPSAIRVERFDDVENLVLVKPGATTERIVVGAHYDKVREGCGAIDNWTGQVAMAHLYRTLRDIPLRKTLVFVAFGREEKGLVGSRAMTRAIPDAEVAGYCAMVNIDSLGVATPQVADNMSSKPLARFAGDVAKEMEIPFAHAAIGRANSDSSAFVARRIPAVTLHGLSNDWATLLHSRNDQADRIHHASVYLGYRLALGMLVRLDAAACDAYR